MPRIVTRTLESGMTLAIEPVEGVRSLAISWLVPAGVSSEPRDRLGLAAMWDELIHRGSGERSSREMTDAVDRLGVSRSSSVGMHHLALGFTLMGDRLDGALPLAVDMVRRPRAEDSSIEPTRDLALQAIAALADEPAERATLSARLRHMPVPFNRSTLGEAAGIRAATRAELVSWWEARARPTGSIMAIAGDVRDADGVARRLDALLRGWTGEATAIGVGEPGSRGYAHESAQTNQVQIVLLHDAPREADDDSVLERVVAAVLSGGSSSRLFTEVRERRGLCYAVSATYAAGLELGVVVAYVGTTPERAQTSLDVLWAELQRVREGVTREEFERAIVLLKSRLVFSGESTAARAGAIAQDIHRLGRPRSLEERSAELDRVTLDAVNAYLARREIGRVTLQSVGPAALRSPA